MTDEPTMNEPTPDEYDEIGRRMLGRARRGERRRLAIRFAAVGIAAAALTAAVLLPSTISALTADDGSELRSAQRAEAEEEAHGEAAGDAGGPEAQEESEEAGGGARDGAEKQSHGEIPTVLCYAEADPSAERVALSGDPAGDEAWAVEACDRIWAPSESVEERGTGAVESYSADGGVSYASRLCRASAEVLVVSPESGERNAELCEEIGGDTPR